MGLEQWVGKVALVTGATSGIGEDVARRLGAEGMRVAITGRRRERLDSVAEAIREAGGEALVHAADFTKPGEIRATFAAVREAWGGTDVLINNAGLGYEDALRDGKADEWEAMLDVNVLGMSVAMQEAVREMEPRGAGQIVNVSSIAAYGVVPGQLMTMYAATKHAVRALTEGMRHELVNRGSALKVGCVSPGRVQTGFHEAAFRSEERAQEGYTAFQPLTPADIADIIAYMLSTPPHVQINDVIVRPVEQLH